MSRRWSFVQPCPQRLYASIRNEPLKFPEDDGNDLTLTFFNPDREGWLLKKGELEVQVQRIPQVPGAIPGPADSAVLVLSKVAE